MQHYYVAVHNNVPYIAHRRDGLSDSVAAAQAGRAA
jgi:hypothetical protein